MLIKEEKWQVALLIRHVLIDDQLLHLGRHLQVVVFCIYEVSRVTFPEFFGKGPQVLI